MGITQHICGTHNVFAVANLSMLCGQIGKASSGVNPLRGQNNVQGACDMGALPGVFSGYQAVTVEENRNKMAAAWGVKDLPAKPGLTVGEMVCAAGEQIKGLYIMGENPVLADADGNHVIHALKHLDFLVVQDIFLTETAELADVVLPAASFAEKDGTFSNTERRVQRVRKAIEPVGNARADWEIVCQIATAMGYPMHYNSAEEIMAEISKVTPAYGGISYARLEQEKSLQWPCPTAEHQGTPFLHIGKFSRGLGKFHAVEHIPQAEIPDAEYPLILNTGRRLYHYHTGTMTQRTGALEVAYGEEYLEINAVDAEALCICDGDMVKVTSRRGQVEVAARITSKVTPGMVFTSFHYPEVAINQLTNSASCPIAKIPELKVCAVKVEKVG
jgi:predicted molibdopterin-dependent oxidoreductase YjgC